MSKIKEATEALLNSEPEVQDKIIAGLVNESQEESKQYLIFNRSLNMPAGKLAAQLSHASVGCVLQLFQKSEYPNSVVIGNSFYKDSAAYKWLFNKFTKVVLYVKSEESLLNVYNKAKDDNFNTVLIKDEGRTVFNEPTYTCVGIGPVYPSEVKHIVGKLQLYKD